MTAVADIGDIVRVVNKGDAPFTIGWDSRQYKLEPGADSFVPFEAACLWFGDPRSTNSIQSATNQHGLVSFIPDRDSEVRRLRVKYGNIGGDERFIDPAPDVEVYDLSGEVIVTVLNDPEGENVTLAAPTVVDQSNLMATIQRQQAQIDLLLAQFGLQKKDEEEEGGEETSDDEEVELDDDGLPVDTSTNS